MKNIFGLPTLLAMVIFGLSIWAYFDEHLFRAFVTYCLLMLLTLKLIDNLRKLYE